MLITVPTGSSGVDPGSSKCPASDALEAVRKTLAERGIVFAPARAKFELRELRVSAGFIDRIGEDKVFMTLPTAVAAHNESYAAPSRR